MRNFKPNSKLVANAPTVMTRRDVGDITSSKVELLSIIHFDMQTAGYYIQ